MNFQTVRSLPSVMNVSVAPNLFSSHHSWVWNPLVFTKLSSTQSSGATLISVRTCTPTMSCPVVPPCTLVLLIVCRRKSPPSHHPPSRLRSLLPLSENTPYGSVAPSSPPSPLSSPCGSPRKNTTSPAPESSTANVSKLFSSYIYFIISLFKMLVFICYPQFE